MGSSYWLGWEGNGRGWTVAGQWRARVLCRPSPLGFLCWSSAPPPQRITDLGPLPHWLLPHIALVPFAHLLTPLCQEPALASNSVSTLIAFFLLLILCLLERRSEVSCILSHFFLDLLLFHPREHSICCSIRTLPVSVSLGGLVPA